VKVIAKIQTFETPTCLGQMRRDSARA